MEPCRRQGERGRRLPSSKSAAATRRCGEQHSPGGSPRGDRWQAKAGGLKAFGFALVPDGVHLGEGHLSEVESAPGGFGFHIGESALKLIAGLPESH